MSLNLLPFSCLNEIVKDMMVSVELVIPMGEYTYKFLIGNKAKIFLVSIASCRPLVHKLKELKINFHTFQVKQDRMFGVVVKNMHYSTHISDIRLSIEKFGHKVRNVLNIRDFRTQSPLSMLFVDLELSQNNKDTYNLPYLSITKVIFEPHQIRSDIVQWKKCQQYGHTKTYCWYPICCFNCCKNYDTITCTKPITCTETPKCTLCEGNHPANCKWCVIYREMKTKLYPPMRQRPLKEQKTTTERVLPQGTIPNPCRKWYMLKLRLAVKPSQRINTNTSEQTIISFVDKFEKLLMQQTYQIGTLMNLLTMVIRK